MRFDILTIFPKIFDSYFRESILKRAQEKKLIEIQAYNIRDYSKDKHRKVDDRPYGGGAGMVMAAPPIMAAVRDVRIDRFVRAKRSTKFARRGERSDRPLRTRVILFSTRGKVFTNRDAKRLAKYNQLVLVCGRYEGVDERVAQQVADEEISLGDYVITGGELAAMIVIDAVSRQIPGVLGKQESLEEKQGSYPVYTRPEEVRYKLSAKSYKLLKVPKVLLMGHHKNIARWRKEQGSR